MSLSYKLEMGGIWLHHFGLTPAAGHYRLVIDTPSYEVKGGLNGQDSKIDILAICPMRTPACTDKNKGSDDMICYLATL